MIDILQSLSEKETNLFYKNLSLRLLEVFGEDSYSDLEDLQLSFEDWKLSDIRDYRATLDYILSEISPEGYELTWRDLKKLNRKRWNFCRCCGKPFLRYDKQNRMGFCYYETYRRYKVGKGEFFRLAEQGVSACYAQYANTRKYSKDFQYKS
jgi:hypothetical protein